MSERRTGSASTLHEWTRVPLEALIVFGVLASLFAVSLLSAVGWFDLVRGGMAVSVLSAAIGLPLEVVYFSLMLVFARRAGSWESGWIWRSFEQHHRLGPRQRWAALPFFFVGAAAFGIATLAILATIFGLFLGHSADWRAE